jgi:hypothetical protein
MPFGKYEGRTLPQVLLRDPDYFFWLVREGVLKGALAMQAKQLAKKACRLKIPREPPDAFVVDYFFNSEDQFSRALVLFRRTHIDHRTSLTD